MKTLAVASLVSLVLCSAACSRGSSGAPAPTTAASNAIPATGSATGAAVVGKPAPDFTLTDLDGHAVSLANFKGKTIVLEWFNPGCPFVRKSHTVGSLKGEAARVTADGVVWLAINSAASGKQGADPDMNRKVAAEYGMTHPILLDPTGTVGHAYGATNTPNMYVIDPTGTLVYRGAIDNSPDGEGESPTDGKLVNYVDDALAALKAKQPVKVPETKAYGCGVKYGTTS